MEVERESIAFQNKKSTFHQSSTNTDWETQLGSNKQALHIASHVFVSVESTTFLCVNFMEMYKDGS